MGAIFVGEAAEEEYLAVATRGIALKRAGKRRLDGLSVMDEEATYTGLEAVSHGQPARPLDNLLFFSHVDGSHGYHDQEAPESAERGDPTASLAFAATHGATDTRKLTHASSPRLSTLILITNHSEFHMSPMLACQHCAIAPLPMPILFGICQVSPKRCLNPLPCIRLPQQPIAMGS